MADITLGLVGLFCLILAWLPQTIDVLRTKTSRMNPNFAALYMVGSWILAYYSWTINDIAFMALNAISGLMSLANFYYSLITFRKEAAHRARHLKAAKRRKR